MFDHCPGNGEAVKSTGSTSDLIQDQKATGSGIAKNIGNLRHFHHKGTLSACKVIRCTYTGEDPVNHTDVCTVCRNKASDLCHQYDQGCLAHICGFSGHVWSCDNGDPFFVVVKIRIVWNEHIIFDHLLHNRMTAVSDINEACLIDLWPDEIIPLGNQCKRSENIQCSHCFCSALDTDNFRSNLITDTGKQFKFQRIKLILSSKDQIFQIFQFLSDITLCIGKGLFADIILRHKIFESIGNFQRITKYTIVLDLQAFDTGTFPLSCLQLRKPFLSICPGTAEFIYIFIISFPDNATVFLGKRRIIGDRVPDQRGNVCQRIHIFVDLSKQWRFEFCQDLFYIRKHFQRRGKRNQISRISGFVTDTADQTFQIIDRV